MRHEQAITQGAKEMTGAVLDLSGKKFGKLTAIERIIVTGNTRRRWLCKCECGNFTKSHSNWLVSGKSTSCGCTRRKSASEKSFVDITNKRFSRLVALKMVGTNSHSKRVWNCLCDCGKEVNVVYSGLVSGNTRSCGCLSKEENIKRSTKHGMCKLTYSERCEADPVFAMAQRIRGLVANCFKNKCFKKPMKTEKMLGCTFEEFKIHIEKQFTKGMGWENRSYWHIDHIIPLSTAKNIDDVIKLNHHTNLRPIFAIDNLKKHAKAEFLI